MKRVVLLLLVLTVFLQGCWFAPAEPAGSGARVVTRVNVDFLRGDGESFRVYTSEEKIRIILDYINGLEGEEAGVSAPEDNAGALRVTCVYANGTEKHYYLTDKQYFREEDGPWMESEGAETELFRLLLETPGDILENDGEEPDGEQVNDGEIKLPTNK